MYFRNYKLSKTSLDHTLKTAVSKHLLTVNMLKDPKSLRYLYETTFT